MLTSPAPIAKSGGTIIKSDAGGGPERLLLSVCRVAIVVFLYILVPLLFHLNPPPLSNHPLCVAWIFLLLAATRLTVIILRHSPSLLDITFWSFVYIFFGAAAIDQIQNNSYPLAVGSYTPSELLTTQLRIAVGIACYCVGRWLWNRLAPHRRRLPDWNNLDIVPQRVLLLGALAIPIALALAVKTGIHSFFESRDTLALSLYNASGSVVGLKVYEVASKVSGSFQQIFLEIPPFVALVYLLVTKLWRRHKYLLIGLIGVCAITDNPISSARAWTAVVIVGLFAALVNLSPRSRHVYFALGLLLTSMFSLSYLNVFRTPAADRIYSSSTTASLPQQLQSADYGMFQQEVNGTVWIQDHGFTNGRQLAGSILVYVPRSVWHSKPTATGNIVSQQIEVDADNSSSLWTEFYIDFGYPELIILFLLLGYFFGYLDTTFARSTSRAAQVIIPIIATDAVLFLRGSLQPTVAYAIPLFLVLFICTRHSNSGSISGDSNNASGRSASMADL